MEFGISDVIFFLQIFSKMMNFLANPRCGDVFQKLLKKVFIILMILRALQGKKISTIFNTVIKFRVSEKANLPQGFGWQVSKRWI